MEIYSKLQGDDGLTSFRILALQPGEWGDKINCRLIYTALGKAPEYYALCYAWGPQGATWPVIVNNKEVKVRVNLDSALRHLRRRDTTFLVWVDALVRRM